MLCLHQQPFVDMNQERFGSMHAVMRMLLCAETASVDIAIFCLALMGTDYPTFLEEAHRVLKQHGLLWIAEVRISLSFVQMPIF